MGKKKNQLAVKSKRWLAYIQELLTKHTGLDSSHYWHRKGKSGWFNYRMEHTKAVVAIAMDLAKLTEADKDVVMAAAWLHDIGKLEGYRELGQSHGLVGAKIAEKILKRTNFPKKKIPLVVDAISKHVGLYKDHKVTPLEAAIIWDADKLSKLGASGTAINMLYKPAFHLNKHGVPPMLEDVLCDHREWNGMGKKIVKSLNLSVSRKIGRNRLRFLEKFYEQLQGEVLGEK